ncbi:hypothetical protein PV327_008246 [Microctonus hyperodae]|uniref:Major facilitator superfamily domain-containing protein 12-like n=1 Tax=Microctonus hyperodae TaxID=165561 RepID=A0AA39F2P6_MICHY|nr:hypothetical protein PV327_008246 [Microctonus hyperodae]
MDRMVNPVENDYTEIVQRLPKKQKWAYGVGHILNDICASIWFTYLIVFFHLVLGFDPVLSGVVLLIGQIADAIATPFVGLQSDIDDNFWLCRYGRRKTWHLLGTGCVLLSFPFIFSQCVNCVDAHHWAQIIYYAAFIIIFQFGWAAVQISHLSLIPDLTPSEHERTELTAIRYTFTVFANIFVYCITWAVLHLSGDDSNALIGPKDAFKFQEIILISISIGFLSSVIFHLFVKENPYNSTGPTRRHLRPASEFLKDVQFYQVAAVYMPTRLFANISQIYVPLYLHDSLKMPATSLAIIPLIMYLSSFQVSLVIDKINKKLGRKIAYSIGVILGVCACTWIWLGKGTTFISYEIYPVALLLGAAGSVMLVTSLGLTADLIGENTESGAFVYGAMSFTDKLCNGLVVMVIQYTRCTTNCSDYYRNVLSFVCGGSAVFGLVMILLIKSFSRYDDDYQNMETDASSEPVEDNYERSISNNPIDVSNSIES